MINKLKKISKLSIVVMLSLLLVSAAAFYYWGNNSEKKTITNFIISHYTVTDKELFSEKELDEESAMEYLLNIEKKFKNMNKFFTDKGEAMYNQGSGYIFHLLMPRGGDYTVKVKNIKLNLKEVQEDGIKSYNAAFTLIKNHRKSGKETKETINKVFYLSKENNQWKLNEFNSFYDEPNLNELVSPFH